MRPHRIAERDRKHVHITEAAIPGAVGDDGSSLSCFQARSFLGNGAPSVQGAGR